MVDGTKGYKELLAGVRPHHRGHVQQGLAKVDALPSNEGVAGGLRRPGARVDGRLCRATDNIAAGDEGVVIEAAGEGGAGVAEVLAASLLAAQLLAEGG
jgi:hypothetical protein